MKDTLTDANFPRTGEGRVYHLGLKPGEVANRILTVGSPSRAKAIASLLDAEPKPFFLSSERGFNTYTGCFHGVPVSIISIGMGAPNMDFFVRETRECVSGDMVIIRLGSCGGLNDIPVGSVAIPKASVGINRNLDFDFAHPDECTVPAYFVSKPINADPELHQALRRAVESLKPTDSNNAIFSNIVNAAADSFYSSQGRQTSFPDANEHLIANLIKSVDGLSTLEMETTHLFHLAKCWSDRSGRTTETNSSDANVTDTVNPPLTTGPVQPTIERPEADSTQTVSPQVAGKDTIIRAAAIQMVFASRNSRDFITPNQVNELEEWTGKATLVALASAPVDPNRLHPDAGSVWAKAS